MTTHPALPERLAPTSLDRDEGHRLLDLLQDEATQQATPPGLERVAPGYADWIVTALFGGTYQREGLSLRDRRMINLAALTEATTGTETRTEAGTGPEARADSASASDARADANTESEAPQESAR
ncbi:MULTISPECIES: hypothetical protein [unclassified Streptomyces]|uniref:hypothetical protein n=1 Tax=unclassified Streptomyces TaxID=2593676 RepID=UPI001CB729A8|nr:MULTISPECIES: hypothetical protein [unclassified Streptomyces]